MSVVQPNFYWIWTKLWHKLFSIYSLLLLLRLWKNIAPTRHHDLKQMAAWGWIFIGSFDMSDAAPCSTAMSIHFTYLTFQCIYMLSCSATPLSTLLWKSDSHWLIQHILMEMPVTEAVIISLIKLSVPHKVSNKCTVFKLLYMFLLTI